MGTTSYNTRQKRAFSQTFDIFAPQAIIASVAHPRVAQGWHHGEAPVATAVRGRIMSKSEASAPLTGSLRVGKDQFDTTDVLRLPLVVFGDDGSELEIAENWVVQVKTGAGSENGQYFVVGGEAQQHTHRATERKHLIRRFVRPGSRTT